MLTEAGLVRASIDGGREFVFRPSFARIASLGNPHEIVAIYAGLHGPKAAEEATYVLACLCDQEDASELIGGRVICMEAPPAKTIPWWKFWARQEAEPTPPGQQMNRVIAPAMPIEEQIIVARHLMRHGIVGTARPGGGDGGKFSDRFDATEYVSAARVHLGLSSDDAEALSMTEFQTMLAMKFPQAKPVEMPSRAEYDAAVKAAEERRGGN